MFFFPKANVIVKLRKTFYICKSGIEIDTELRTAQLKSDRLERAGDYGSPPVFSIYGNPMENLNPTPDLDVSQLSAVELQRLGITIAHVRAVYS